MFDRNDVRSIALLFCAACLSATTFAACSGDDGSEETAGDDQAGAGDDDAAASGAGDDNDTAADDTAGEDAAGDDNSPAQDDDAADDDASGCTGDRDCPGDEVCDAGVCVAPSDDDAADDDAADDDTADDDAADDDATGDDDTAGTLVTDPGEQADYETRWANCEFKAGDKPDVTLPPSSPKGDQIPIDHVIVIMQENRSFDHYYQRLPEYGQPDVDVAPADFANPDEDGTPIPIYHESKYCIEDVAHGWNASHIQYNGGAMDGFVTTNNPDGARAMGYYDATDLEYYYALASTFGIADRNFCGVLGPTWPNRMYILGATSWGRISNNFPPGESKGATIFDALERKKVSWKIYAGDTSSAAIFIPLMIANRDKFVAYDKFAEDVDAGALPQFAWVEPKFQGEFERTDEHPPGDMQLGQQFVAGVIDKIMHSEYWPRTAIFVTYDEHGGYYDHVPPPPACKPDDIAPDTKDEDEQAEFDRFGFRVPLLVVSPYAKAHFVSHTVNSITSVTRFLETRFDIPALTARDANANPLLEFFDFDNPPFMTPPDLPPPQVDQDKLQVCEEEFPNTGGGLF